MKLDLYLSANGISDSAFADRVGLSRSMVTRLRLGTARPSARIALKIEEATTRSVTLADLLTGFSKPTSEPQPAPANQGEAA